MKAKIDSGCIGCRLCAQTCPEVFGMDDDGLAEVISETVPKDAEGSAVEAQEGCPVSVITVENSPGE
ncbi:MAG: ferredoxin [Clostridiaceae bacterium]|nr:ferredoxin [Clostridiaceae bacterium]